MLPSPTSSTPVESAFTGMQGTLWKWTNYLSGWQPRWFVLEGGILTYYLSPNEIHLGSRGALKIPSCDITVHPSDKQRLDIAAPGGRHIYLRAVSMSERQQWLLALGVAKQTGLQPDQGDGKGSGSVVQSKMSELHKNCQLLVSQIASIRTLTSDVTSADSKALEDLSSQVSVTCDKFLSVLQECVDLSLTQEVTSSLKPLPLKELYVSKKGGKSPVISKKGQPSSGFSVEELYPSPPTPSSSLPPIPSELTSKKSYIKKTSSIEGKSLPIHLLKESAAGGSQVHSHMLIKTRVEDSETPGDETDSNFKQPDSIPAQVHSSHSRSHSTSDHFITPTTSPQPTPPLCIKDRITVDDGESARRHETFFSSLPTKFQDLVLEEKDGIPSEAFLQSCQAVLPFFDTLNATAFAPVKVDISGNIQKLNKKFGENREAFWTLQAMVESELQAGTHNNKDSATDALLWLKRAMEFVQKFIAEVAGGEKNLDVAAGKAYSVSLRRFHSWIVRGIFNLAMKAVPYHCDFLKLLGSLGTDEGERQVIADMAVFAASLGEIVHILNQFYQQHNLDPLPSS